MPAKQIRVPSLKACHQALALAFAFLAPDASVQAADLIVPNAATVTLSAGTYSYVSVIVQSGGTLQVNDVVALITDHFEVESGGLVDGLGQGYQGGAIAGNGPGAGINYGEGAGHGGRGGVVLAASGLTYGNGLLPLLPGSSGGASSFFPGGAGGAALQVSAGGSVIVAGIIDLRGQEGSYSTQAGGGGSGGGLYLEGASLSVSGELRLGGGNGGGGTVGGGGGGGGRVALRSRTGSFSVSGSVDVSGGGNGSGTSSLSAGGAGSIAYLPGNDLEVPGLLSLGPSPASYQAVRILGQGELSVPTGLSLNAASVQLDPGGRLLLAGPLAVSGGLSMAGNALLRIQSVSLTLSAASLAPGNRLELQGGAHLRLPSAGLPSGLSLTVKDSSLSLGASFSLGPGDYLDLQGLLTCDQDLSVLSGASLIARGVAVIQAQRFLLEAGGLVDGNERGYPAGQGPGHSADEQGAGHGNYGGYNGFRGNTVPGGPPYDDPLSPAEPGSGGTASSAGGACVRVIASQGIGLSGTVRVDGGTSTAGSIGGAGGSGGSVYLSAPLIWGPGSLSARGGNGGGGGLWGGAGAAGGLIYVASSGSACGQALSADVSGGSGALGPWGNGTAGGDGLFGISCPPTPTPTFTPSFSVSPTPSTTPTASPSATASPTPTATPSASPTQTVIPVGTCPWTGWGPTANGLGPINAGFAFAARVRFEQDVVVSRLRAHFSPSSGSGLLRLALYSSNGTRPVSLLLAADETAYGPGAVAATVPPTQLPAGEYWIVMLSNAPFTVDAAEVPGLNDIYSRSLGYGPFPASWSGGNANFQETALALQAETCGLGTTLTPTLTSTHSPTATASPTPSASPSISPTPTLSATATPTPSPAAAPRLSTTGHSLLGPAPVKRGRPLCAWFKAPPHWAEVELFNVSGEHVAHAALDGGGLCLATERLAPGVYLARIRTESAEGREERMQKVAVVR
jgi:hypothetical protein